MVELMDIGASKAAAIFNQVVLSEVRLRVPLVRAVSSPESFAELFPPVTDKVTTVLLGFDGKISGAATLHFPPGDADRIADILAGNQPDSLGRNSMKVATVSELGNIMLNAFVGAISNIIGEHFQFSVPTYEEGVDYREMTARIFSDNDVIVHGETWFSVDTYNIMGDTCIFLDLASFHNLVESVNKLLAVA